jgi:hypothetical protein
MKYFGKYGRLLVSIALNRANVGETLNVAEKGVFADGTEVLSDALKVMWTQWLIRKSDDLVLEPYCTQLSNLVTAELTCEINTFDAGTAGAP